MARTARKVNVTARRALYEPWEWWSKEEWLERWLRDEAKRRGVTPKQIDEMDMKVALAGAILESPMFTIRNFFFTRTKKSDVVLIEPFVGQVILDVTCEAQRKLGYAQRVIEIKPRQVGWTSWNLGRAGWYALQPNNIVTFFVPDQKVVDEMNSKFGVIYNNLGWLAPMRRIDNKQRVEFSNPNPKLREEIKGLDSSITFAVPSGQRGRTPNVAILSEFAHWLDDGFDADEVLTGLMSGMSVGPESCVIIDTTPNGYDEDYWPMVEEAVEANPKWVANWERKEIPTREDIVNGILGEPDTPDEGWVPAFSPWFWHDEYAARCKRFPMGQLPPMTPKQRQHLEATLGKHHEFGNDEEVDLMERYGVSLEQIWWRRWKIKNDIQGYDARQKLLTFRQEYASSWRSCFIDFGHTAFDPLGMECIQRMVKPPAARGMLRRENEGGTLKWEIDEHWPSPWEEMRFWAPSDPSEKYVIGVDLGWSFETMEADQTVAQVLRRRDRKQVAVYASRAPMHTVRKRLADLYHYYNRAFLGIETKGPGKNLVFELYQMGVTNQYKWKRLDKEDVKDTDWLGWETSEHTRPVMEGILCEEIAWRDADDNPAPGIVLRDEETVNQLFKAKRQSDGNIKGRGQDDYMDALMIALAINRDPNNPYTPPREADQRRELNNAVGEWYSKLGIFGPKSKYEPRLEDM